MTSRSPDGLDGLQLAYESLVKAGSNSLSAAYRFGQVIDALSGPGYYTHRMLGEAIGRSGAMIGVYARLYRSYHSERHLLATADKMGTYDVSVLAGKTPQVAVKYTFKCENCGSSDIVKERVRPEVPASAEVTEHAARVS
jgi:hypothetical protein